MSEQSNLKCGDAIYTPKFSGGTPHLWIIVTEPNGHGEVVMVNVTSWRVDSDQTVIVSPGEHHRITHRSVVFYQDARTANAEAIRRGVEAGICVQCDVCSQELLSRIQEGLKKSKFTPRKIIDFCEKSWIG